MSSSCNGCSSADSCGGACPSQEPVPSEAQQHTNIKHVIVVMSGKGGVGKSSFTSLLAMALKNNGHTVGILDADVTGPSIPKLFGKHGNPPMGEHGIEPVRTEKGIGLMSMNFLLPNEDDPVVWRGPILGNVVKEFFEEVCWGDLDYLLIDLPPGTGDVPLTILQNIRVDGVVIVTTPQSLSNMVVRKGIKMLEIMDVRPLALAENMSYVQCPGCDEKVEIFGKSHVEETANTFNIPILGHFPLDPKLAELGDEGKIETYSGPVLVELEKNLDVILKQMEDNNN